MKDSDEKDATRKWTRAVYIGGKRYVVIAGPEPYGKCAYCGTVDELRPYGREKAEICYDCAMKPENKAEARRRLDAILEGRED
jgi:hypothetical protein